MPEVLDPSGFQMQVVLTSPESGSRTPLWMSDGSSSDGGLGGAPAAGGGSVAAGGGGGDKNKDLAIVESVQLELNMGLNGKITVEIAAPFDVGLDLLGNGELFKINNIIELQIGYPRIGRFTPWFAGLLSKPSLRISPDDGFTATLNGEGAAFAAQRRKSQRTWQGSYRSILETLAEEHGWELKLPDDLGPLADDRAQISQSNKTDWNFIQAICRAANCDAFMAASKDIAGKPLLVVGSRKEWLAGKAPQGARDIVLGVRTRADFNNVFPVLDFASESEGVWLTSGAGTVKSGDIDVDSKESASVSATTEKAEVPRLGDASVKAKEKRSEGQGGVGGAATNLAVGAASSAVGEGAALVSDSAGSGASTVDVKAELIAQERDARDAGDRLVVSSRDPRGSQQLVDSAHDEAVMRGGINATVTTFGIPDLFPTQVISIAGLGVFDGPYGIEGVTHRAMPGEWTMTLRLLRNAFNQDMIARGASEEAPKRNEGSARIVEEAVSNLEAEGGGTDTVDPEVGGL